jgi:glutamyl-tRNA reductase
VASAAVHLAQQFFAGFKKHTALLVGAGVTIELVAKHLVSHEIGRLFVANRSVDRARDLAKQFGGYALPLSEIGGTLPEADILITSTAATEPVVTTEQIAKAIKARKRKPMFACDIAVPRDIEASAGDLSDFFLYTRSTISTRSSSKDRATGKPRPSRRIACSTRKFAGTRRSSDPSRWPRSSRPCAKPMKR